MKNKKGFTLIELVAVMTLLAIIMVVAFPNFTKMTSSAKSNFDRTTQVIIKSAASMYVNNHMEEVNSAINTNSYYCLPLGKLIVYEYLDSDIKTSSNEPINKNKIIKVTKTENKFQYDLTSNLTLESCGITDYLPPRLYIKLKSDESQVVDPNNVTATSLTDYESKYKITTNEGLDSNIVRTISKGHNSKKLLLEYNVKDSSGNEAIPLKVQLTIQ